MAYVAFHLVPITVVAVEDLYRAMRRKVAAAIA
jgi:hypothetical protein